MVRSQLASRHGQSLRQDKREELGVLDEQKKGCDREEQQVGGRGPEHGLDSIY